MGRKYRDKAECRDCGPDALRGGWIDCRLHMPLGARSHAPLQTRNGWSLPTQLPLISHAPSDHHEGGCGRDSVIDRPGHARRGIPGHPRGHFRLRYDVTDSKGAMTLRRAGRLYPLKSVLPSPAGGSWPSSTSRRSRASPSTAASSSRPT